MSQMRLVGCIHHTYVCLVTVECHFHGIVMANSTAPCLFEGQHSSHQGASEERQLSQSYHF